MFFFPSHLLGETAEVYQPTGVSPGLQKDNRRLRGTANKVSSF